jgi:hypothetical protein
MYYRRPLWDIVVILLSVGGLALSVRTLVPSLAPSRATRAARAQRFRSFDRPRRSEDRDREAGYAMRKRSKPFVIDRSRLVAAFQMNAP